MIKEKAIANYFEECLKQNIEPKTAANWITGLILGYLYKYEMEITDFFITPKRLFDITEAIKKGTISSKQGKDLFYMTLEQEKEPLEIMKEQGMMQISDENALCSIVEEVLNENLSQIELYHNGKTNMFDYFVGQVMKKTKGQANPVMVKEILTAKLSK